MFYLNFVLALLFIWANGPAGVNELSEDEKIAVFDERVETLYQEIGLADYKLDPEAWRYAMIGYFNLKGTEKLKNKDIISIIDFNKASVQERFYTIDLKNKKVIYHSLVSHGQNSGHNYAKDFSNIPSTNKSSMGFYLTAETYTGKHGHSLRLDGLDVGYNSNARKRAIVMHGADYVNKKICQEIGRLGRSWGCPALPKGLHEEVIETIKEQSLIFAYYKSKKYLQSSKYLNLLTAVKAMKI